jgi:hypothetical protein
MYFRAPKKSLRHLCFFNYYIYLLRAALYTLIFALQIDALVHFNYLCLSLSLFVSLPFFISLPFCVSPSLPFCLSISPFLKHLFFLSLPLCLSLFLSTVALSMLLSMRLCHPPDGSTSHKYKLLCFITTKKFAKR